MKSSHKNSIKAKGSKCCERGTLSSLTSVAQRACLPTRVDMRGISRNLLPGWVVADNLKLVANDSLEESVVATVSIRSQTGEAQASRIALFDFSKGDEFVAHALRAPVGIANPIARPAVYSGQVFALSESECMLYSSLTNRIIFKDISLKFYSSCAFRALLPKARKKAAIIDERLENVTMLSYPVSCTDALTGLWSGQGSAPLIIAHRNGDVNLFDIRQHGKTTLLFNPLQSFSQHAPTNWVESLREHYLVVHHPFGFRSGLGATSLLDLRYPGKVMWTFPETASLHSPTPSLYGDWLVLPLGNSRVRLVDALLCGDVSRIISLPTSPSAMALLSPYSLVAQLSNPAEDSPALIRLAWGESLST